MVKYSYLANGSKSEAENGSGVGLVYRGSLIYRKAADGTLTLEGASLPEGRLTVNGVRWHVKDHLGSVRAVVDGSTGNLLAVTDYDAYGEDAANSTASPYLSPAPSGETFRERFTSKEDQGPDFGTAYTDFGARQYNPTLRRWLVPDPLSEKYYGISPYAYCAGDPVNLVDPKGDTLRFAADVSEAFKRAFAEAVQYMNASETSYNLAKLHSSSNVYYIEETHNASSFFHPGDKTNGGSSGTVYWNSNVILETGEGVWISPITQLAHEFGHAAGYDESPEDYNRRKASQDSQYNNKEERKVILTTEQYAAQQHGEIQKGETTRTRHDDKRARIWTKKNATVMDLLSLVIEHNNKRRNQTEE